VLKQSSDGDIAGLAAKIDREEAYHRMHAEMWFERLKDEPRFAVALAELEPLVDARGEHVPEFADLWEEMTTVRRSIAGAAW
jgi:1,2-phenylacetyl-CoA epoxidase catalytic subunit